MNHWVRALIAVATTVAALALPASANAVTYQFDGRQKAIDADKGIYQMSGGLIGRWVTTSSKDVAAKPYYETMGTERFRGCLDRRRDGSCVNDPRGTLLFDFRLWALLAPKDPAGLIWGACWHPVTGGTGDFSGAKGVLTFVDWPVGDQVKTKYLGVITTNSDAAARRTPAATAATRKGC